MTAFHICVGFIANSLVTNAGEIKYFGELNQIGMAAHNRACPIYIFTFDQGNLLNL